MTLHTPHLRVHFEEGYENVAMQAAVAGEDAIAAVSARLGAWPEQPVHVALVDESDLANGYTDVTFYGRIVILPVFPVGLGYTTGLSPRMADWIRLVVTHEMVHALQLDMAEGPTRALRDVFGHVPSFSTPNAMQPPAWLEGIATHGETQLVAGGRGDDPFFDMFLRTAVLSGRVPRMDQALGSYDLGTFQPAGHVYLYGYAWFDYLERHFGGEAIAEFERSFARATLARTGDAVRRAFGDDPHTVWNRMIQELAVTMGDQAARIEAQGVTEPVPIPMAGGWVALSPRPSPSGRYLAYTAAGPYLEDVRVIDVETGNDRQLAVGLVTAPGGLSWTPDERTVLYAAVDETAGRFLSDLYAADVETGEVRRITRGLRAWSPTPGPGGEIAFVMRDGLETVVAQMPGGALQGGISAGARPLWEPPPGWQILGASWGPTGESLAMSAWKPGGGSDILILHMEQASGGAGWQVEGVSSVTDDLAVDDRPSWSPDGRYLYFHSDRDGVYNLYAWDSRTHRTFRLTNVLSGLFDPAASPDGRFMFAAWFGADGYQLARIPWGELRWEPAAAPSLRPEEPSPADKEPGGDRAQAGGDGPDGWDVSAYDPWESLRPTYWEPIWGSDWAGPYLGAATSGLDALGERSFSVAAAIGLLSGTPVLYGGYAQRLGPTGFTALIEAVVQPSLLDSGEQHWAQEAAARAAVQWERGGYAGAREVALSAVRSWRRDAFPHGVPWAGASTQSYVTLDAIAARRWGDHRTVATQYVESRAMLVTEADGRSVRAVEGGRITAGWTLDVADVSGRGVTVSLQGGLAGTDPLVALPVGGDTGPFALRALAAGDLQARAAAAGLQVERRWRLVAFRSGMGDSPTFFDDLSLGVFTEVAAGWDRAAAGGGSGVETPGVLRLSPWAPAADVGMELTLGLSLDYGRSPVAVRLGVATGVMGTPSRARWYLLLDAR